MNIKSQNINRILKITKHFIKESTFNLNLSKQNDSFYSSQLHNLIPKNTPKHPYINFFKGSSHKTTSSLYFTPPLHPPKQLADSRSLSTPLLFNDSFHPDTSRPSPFPFNSKHKSFRKTFLLSYNSFTSNKSYQHIPNTSLRIINDVLFNENDDPEYQSLQYEEQIIFHDKKKVEKRFKETFLKIIEFYNNYEAVFKNISGCYITKTINAKSENEIMFKLSSVIIEIINCRNVDICYEIEIPLFIAPVFLYNSIDNIPALLLRLISFKNKGKEFSYEIKEMFLDVITYINNTLKESLHKENDIRKYHEFVYTWITADESYTIKVRMPLLTVMFKKTNTIIHKYIDNKLFLYLHNNNFIHWTFYAVHYLYSFKSFRNAVDSISSKMNTSHIKYIGKDIMISSQRIKSNNIDDIELIYFLSSEEGENYLLTIHSILFEVTLNNQFYKTNKNNSMYKATTKKINKLFRNSLCNTQKFIFSFRELTPILAASVRTNILSFLSKFISINPLSKQIEFNYKELHSFPMRMLNYITTKENESNDNTKIFPNYLAKVIYPVFSIKAIDDMGKLSGIIKGDNGDTVHLKEFEMNIEAIRIFFKEGGCFGTNVDLIRKMLFFLEDEFNRNYMLNMDENTAKRQYMRRFSTLRRRTRTKTTMSMSSFVCVGD